MNPEPSSTPSPDQPVPNNTAISAATSPALPNQPGNPPVTTPLGKPSNAVQIVWQWLTYSLWGWTLIVLGILLSATLAYFLAGRRDADYGFLAYTLAPLFVLLPLSVVADRIYRHQEPAQKHGFAAVIMVLHAVSVFLVSLGGLISSVIALFNIILEPGDRADKWVWLITSLVISGLGGLLFGRIIKPARLDKYTKLFPKVVIGISLITVVMAIAGPVRTDFAARADKLIEDNLSTVNSSIQDYARAKKQLPASLNDLTLRSKDAQSLVGRNLVSYRVTSPMTQTTTRSNSLYSYTSTSTTGKYELCVTYKRARNPNDNTSYYPESSTYISNYSHNAGRQCYNQTATSY